MADFNDDSILEKDIYMAVIQKDSIFHFSRDLDAHPLTID
jgi:hypothetical protein